METIFFSRDSEAAFGTQSATMGGSFRSPDLREKWNYFFLYKDPETVFGTESATLGDPRNRGSFWGQHLDAELRLCGSALTLSRYSRVNVAPGVGGRGGSPYKSGRRPGRPWHARRAFGGNQRL